MITKFGRQLYCTDCNSYVCRHVVAARRPRPRAEQLPLFKDDAPTGRPGPISDSDTGWAREAHETYGEL